jgi:predicted MFS family arabinose efflux permease
MIGIVTAGMGMGTVIFSPLTSHFVSAYGWRTAYVITGIIVLVIVVLSAQFLRRKPDQTYPVSHYQEVPHQGSQSEHRDSAFKRVTRTKQFWILATVYFLSGFSQLAVMVHIVPYTSGLGIPPIAASSILAVIGAANIFGRIIMGVINDRIRVRPLLIFILASLLVSLSWLEFTDKLWTFYIFGIIFGFAWGGSSTLQTLVMVELFGLTSLGELVADLGVCACAGGAFGPVATGYIFDVTGSYKLAFLVCAITALVALVSSLWLTPLRSRQEIYRPDSNT